MREDADLSVHCPRRAVEALKLKTLDHLLLSPDERVELIGGEIVRRPMSRFAHGRAQNRTALALGAFDEADGNGGGWWLATEVSVTYEPHECPPTTSPARAFTPRLKTWRARNAGRQSA